MSLLQTRVHIRLGSKRTTVTVDRVLFELMAINLGALPDEPEAHGLVRDWLQDTIISRLGDENVRKSASQWARIYLIEAIAKTRLINRRDDWLIG